MPFQMPHTKKNRLHPESFWAIIFKAFDRSTMRGRVVWNGYHNQAAFDADKMDVLDQKAYEVTEELSDDQLHDLALATLEGEAPQSVVVGEDEDGNPIEEMEPDTRKSFFDGAIRT